MQAPTQDSTSTLQTLPFVKEATHIVFDIYKILINTFLGPPKTLINMPKAAATKRGAGQVKKRAKKG